MNPILFTPSEAALDMPALMRALHISERSPMRDDLQALIAQALPLARPKVLYGLALIEVRDGDNLVIDGAHFTSRVLSVNLSQAHRVFPYLATCGLELEAWSETLDEDILLRYWADNIKEAVLYSVMNDFFAYLDQTYQPGPLSAMNPGSLPDWPMEAQPALFGLLGDPQQAIGVRLTDSMLMIPAKSVSGILFPTQGGFASCQLCPRELCPNRRAPYDPDLYAQKYNAPAA